MSVDMRGQLRRVTVQDVDDTGKQQFVRLCGINGEVLSEVTRLHQWGETGVAPAGSEGLLLNLGGRSDKAFVLGLEHPDLRPTGYASGDKVVYDAHGNIISLVQANIRIVSPGTVTITAPTIVLNGNVHLGGAGGVPASKQGTVDSRGDTDVGGLATKVWVT